MTQAVPVPAQEKPNLAHYAWLLGLLPVIYASSRILVVSRGNTETMRALVQGLDVTALVLATLLPVGATVALWWFISWAANVSNRNKKDPNTQPGETSGFIFIPAIVVLVLTLTTMPAAYVIGNASFLGLLTVCGVVARLTKNQRARGLAIACAALALIGALIAAVVLLVLGFGQSTWLPRENVTVAGHLSKPGYVVSSDVRWTRISSEEGTIDVVPSTDVTSRQTVEPKVDWSDRPLLDTNSNPLIAVVSVVAAGAAILLSLASVAVIRNARSQAGADS